MSTESNRVIFVVIDPSQDKPLALDRAIQAAKISTEQGLGSPALHLFMAVDYDNTDTSADNPAIRRDSSWLFERIVNPVRESGVEFKLEMSWSSDWYGSILAAAAAIQPELVMLPLVNRPNDRDRIFNDSIWRLLRTITCPVYLVRPNTPEARQIVLAAVNVQSHKPEYQSLNEKILDRGRFIAQISNAELHIVNAYKDSLHYPDRSKLARESQVDTANIHVRAGDPDQVIAEVAKELGADLVMVGLQGRNNRWRGNTSERILTKVAGDILTVN